ncbi:hypothetical protein KQ1_02893 [Bacillus cereus BAG3O-1]|nr:hypothetical protein KQ1_02893 [Bacillus cereus BAG3O-1]
MFFTLYISIVLIILVYSITKVMINSHYFSKERYLIDGKLNKIMDNITMKLFLKFHRNSQGKTSF